MMANSNFARGWLKVPPSWSTSGRLPRWVHLFCKPCFKTIDVPCFAELYFLTFLILSEFELKALENLLKQRTHVVYFRNKSTFLFREDKVIWCYHWVDNVNWPPLRIFKLTSRALALRHLLWRRAYARNVSFETLNGGLLTLSTQLIIPNYFVILSNGRSITISYETYPLYSYV